LEIAEFIIEEWLLMSAPDYFQDTSKSDVWFRRRVTIVTAIFLAAGYGLLACFDRQKGMNFHFYWRWSALLWIMIGEGSATFFWRKIWPPPNYPPATRKGVVVGITILALPGLWWLAPPLRFFIGQHWGGAVPALIVVATAVSCAVWLITRLVKAFQSSDEFDLEALKSEEQNPPTDPAAE
jgi:hypothetical protein